MNKKRGRKPKIPNRKMFEILYYNESVRAEDLAKQYGVTKQTIYNWAVKFKKQQEDK